MSKRFGRNRRRKMRNAIETLTSEVVRLRNAIETSTSEVGRVRIALQGLYEQFDAKTHKEFLKALADAGKDPMQPSYTLSGRGVLK